MDRPPLRSLLEERSGQGARDLRRRLADGTVRDDLDRDLDGRGAAPSLDLHDERRRVLQLRVRVEDLRRVGQLHPVHALDDVSVPEAERVEDAVVLDAESTGRTTIPAQVSWVRCVLP